MTNKLKSVLLASALAFTVAQANAATVTWDIVTTYQDLKGSITFNDAPIAGLIDGAYDGNDTHIYGAVFKLSSASLGINYMDSDAYFQPLTNTYDNKHIDSCWGCTISSNVGDIYFSFDDQSDSGSPAAGVSEYYLYVDGHLDGTYRWAFADSNGVNNDTNIPNNNVPEPSALVLLGLGLVGIAATRRRVMK